MSNDDNERNSDIAAAKTSRARERDGVEPELSLCVVSSDVDVGRLVVFVAVEEVSTAIFAMNCGHA
jgi:hypothetical protein